MTNRPLKTKVALQAVAQHCPNSHAWLSQCIAHLEQCCFTLRTGLMLACADEAARTGNLATKYDSYLLSWDDISQQPEGNRHAE